MTDRALFITVALERGIREEDAASLAQTIAGHFRGVVGCKVNAENPAHFAISARLRGEMHGKLLAVLSADLDAGK